jgi:hypothetical protein
MHYIRGVPLSFQPYAVYYGTRQKILEYEHFVLSDIYIQYAKVSLCSLQRLRQCRFRKLQQ